MSQWISTGKTRLTFPCSKTRWKKFILCVFLIMFHLFHWQGLCETFSHMLACSTKYSRHYIMQRAMFWNVTYLNDQISKKFHCWAYGTFSFYKRHMKSISNAVCNHSSGSAGLENTIVSHLWKRSKCSVVGRGKWKTLYRKSQIGWENSKECN